LLGELQLRARLFVARLGLAEFGGCFISTFVPRGGRQDSIQAMNFALQLPLVQGQSRQNRNQQQDTENPFRAHTTELDEFQHRLLLRPDVK
jgi:hypothetical protein